MSLYLAGPMAGYPEFNHPLFNHVATVLRAKGYEVFNPAEADVAEHVETEGRDRWTVTPEERAAFLRRDFKELLSCDGIVLLPAWQTSVGANCELAVAWMADLDVYAWSTEGRLVDSPAMPDLEKVRRHLGDMFFSRYPWSRDM